MCYLFSISHLSILICIPLRAFSSLSERERQFSRENAIQLQSLSRVLGEMKTLSCSALGDDNTRTVTELCWESDEDGLTLQQMMAGHPAVKQTSARDSKLTMLLAPIIQGNTKTSILLFAKDEEDQYKKTRCSLMAYKDVNKIQSACYRTLDVQLSDLNLKHADTVLAPRLQTYPPEQSLVSYSESNNRSNKTTHSSINFTLQQLLDSDASEAQTHVVDKTGPRTSSRTRESEDDPRTHAFNRKKGHKDPVLPHQTDRLAVDRLMDEFHAVMEAAQAIQSSASSIGSSYNFNSSPNAVNTVAPSPSISISQSPSTSEPSSTKSASIRRDFEYSIERDELDDLVHVSFHSECSAAPGEKLSQKNLGENFFFHQSSPTHENVKDDDDSFHEYGRTMSSSITEGRGVANFESSSSEDSLIDSLSDDSIDGAVTKTLESKRVKGELRLRREKLLGTRETLKPSKDCASLLPPFPFTTCDAFKMNEIYTPPNDGDDAGGSSIGESLNLNPFLYAANDNGGDNKRGDTDSLSSSLGTPTLI